MAYVPNRQGVKELSQRFPFYNRSMMTDDIANDILGFDHAMNPWVPANIPGGAGSWSTSIGAGSIMETTTYPHFMRVAGNNGALTYLQWQNAAAKSLVYFNASVGINDPITANALIFEIRCWDTNAPGAASIYFSARWETRASVLSFGWFYGVGVTFAWNNGTAIGFHPWYLGSQFNGTIEAVAGPTCNGKMFRSEGMPAFDTTITSAAVIASIRTVQFYMPPNRYDQIVLDDIQVA